MRVCAWLWSAFQELKQQLTYNTKPNERPSFDRIIELVLDKNISQRSMTRVSLHVWPLRLCSNQTNVDTHIGMVSSDLNVPLTMVFHRRGHLESRQMVASNLSQRLGMKRPSVNHWMRCVPSWILQYIWHHSHLINKSKSFSPLLGVCTLTLLYFKLFWMVLFPVNHIIFLGFAVTSFEWS